MNRRERAYKNNGKLHNLKMFINCVFKIIKLKTENSDDLSYFLISELCLHTFLW